MGINKVQYGNTTLIDLTSDTVTADKLLQGYTAHDRSGTIITGTATGGGTGAISVVDTTDTHGGTIRTITAIDISDTTAQASDVAQGKYFYTADGTKTAGTASGGSATIQSLSVTQNGTYTAPSGVDGYSPVTVNVSGGGSTSVEEKQINFIDYDGTILYSYTAEEWVNVTTLPSNPSHTGLTAQGWNWTKAQIDAQLSSCPDGDVIVGQMYVTTSGDTEIDIEITNSLRLSPKMRIAVNGTVSIDWGDNTTPSTVTGTSLTSTIATTHTYGNLGKYTIKITATTGNYFGFYVNSNSYALLYKTGTQNENRVYANFVKAVRLGNGITNIDNYAFYNCSECETITLPNTITSIGSSSFSSCRRLKAIVIPKGVTSITTTSSFSTCATAKYISLPMGVTSYGNNFFSGCSGLKAVTIPSDLTELPTSFFNNCSNINSITLPNNITTISNNAFSYCYCLTSLTIPSNVSSIGNTAFTDCCGMKEYHIKPTTVPTAGTTIFKNMPTDCIIYVPSASLSDYKTASNWSTYASYMVGE